MRIFAYRMKTVALFGALAASAASASTEDNSGQVNFSGATLFFNFFDSPASTNDYIDADKNGVAGVFGNGVQQLAVSITSCPIPARYWYFQYRSVGSVNGFAEFVDWQLLGTFRDTVPSEAGILNRTEWAVGGNKVQIPNCSECPDLQTGTPLCPESIDGSLLDVRSVWAVRQGSVSTSAWDRNPSEPGYGWNPIFSNTGWDPKLESLERDTGNGTVALNTNFASPDENTIFDYNVAWGPIVYIANRGAGIRDIAITDAKHVFVSGRRISGENLVGVTRSSGSGTHNGIMNTTGIDPAWGRGDNLGNEFVDINIAKLGFNHQPTNCEGSSLVEEAVKNRRLALGYTGLAGGSRAAADALAGRYEIVNVVFDDRGGALPVRPTIDAVLDNCNPDSGYQLGGEVSFVMRGLVDDFDPNSPTFIENRAAAAYLRNIVESIGAFDDPNNIDPNQVNNMPGELLSLTFFLVPGVDCLPLATDPSNFQANANFNSVLQEFVRDNNGLGIGGDTPAYGSINVAGLVPDRRADAAGYSDGSTNGNYYNYHVDPMTPSGGSFVRNTTLNSRNQLAGDFNNDGARDIDDIDGLLAAVDDPRSWAIANSTPANPVVPEIIGDYDGDGNLDTEDVRYHADGLALVNVPGPTAGQLDRRAGFERVDTQSLAQFGNRNYFGTTLATGKPYEAGDSRGDVAGSTAGPAPGAQPLGADGVVDCEDIDYVYANFGDWSDLDQAVFMDLSCDMNGDLLVDAADIAELLEDILGTTLGDVNLDGDVDGDDLAIAQANFGQTGVGYCGGDVDGDGDVDNDDLAIISPGCPSPGCEDGDLDGDCVVGLADLSALLTNYGLSGQGLVGDTDNDGTVGLADLSALLTQYGTDCN